VATPDPAAEPTAPAPAEPSAELAERLWHHRNLGKAFYENPTTQYEAVEELRKALELAPGSARERLNYGLALLEAGQTEAGVAELEKVKTQAPELPHSWFNLGIVHKRESRYPEAIANLERMVELVPDEPVSRYNLGTLYRLTGEPDKALGEFEEAARLDPGLAGPHFQLYNAYRAAGREDDAARELAVFQEIKDRQKQAAVPEDLEWSWYSELLDEVEPAAEPAAAEVEPEWEARELARGLDPATAGLAVLDAGGDGGADLLAWSAAGAALWAGGSGAVEAIGLREQQHGGRTDDEQRLHQPVQAGAEPHLAANGVTREV
jgi:tetratricopeptide (TPR) repeat protein